MIPLTGAVEEYLKQDPKSGHLFVFFNRTFRMVKILYWDGDGYAIWPKRLVQGIFNVPGNGKSKTAFLRLKLLSAGKTGFSPVPRAARNFAILAGFAASSKLNHINFYNCHA